MDSLQEFLRLWLPLTAQGTYRAFAWWEGGPGVRNRLSFLAPTTDQSRDTGAILQLVEQHDELFFYPSTFSQKSTKTEYAEPVPLLWLDLDTCDPRGKPTEDGDFVEPNTTPEYEWPTIWRETSEGRYQALWVLSQTPDVEERVRLNRAAYEAHRDFGADASYDASRRLRLPGTINRKPGRGNFQVRVVETTGIVCDVGALPQSRGDERLTKPAPGLAPIGDPQTVQLIATLPPDIQRLHAETPPVGERSDVLMVLLLKLASLDLTDEQVYQLAFESGSNKFKSRPDRLWREVLQARAMAERPPPGLHIDTSKPPVTRERDSGAGRPQDPMEGWLSRSELPEDYEMKWQVAPYLPKRSVCLVAGMPGTRKSWLVTDLAVCVATGVPFMKSPIQDPGPVFYVAPDDEQERLSERVHLIEKAHGCETPAEFYWRQSGVHFADRHWADRLRAAIEVKRPKLIIMDGIYLMGYNAQDYGSTLPQLLVPMKEMCSEYDLSFVLVHHGARNRKDEDEDPRLAGQGSIFLGAFFTVAWALANRGQTSTHWQKVQWHIGGKGTPGRPSYRLQFGPDLRRYQVKAHKGIWGDDDDDGEIAKQSEF